MEYPKDWDTEERFMGTIVMFLGPFMEETAGFVNTNIAAEDIAKFPRVTLEDYVRITKRQLKEVFEDYEEVDEYSRLVDDVTATVCTFTFTSQGVPGMATVAIFLTEDVGYGMGYFASRETHGSYLHCFELMLSTFQSE